MGEVDIKIEELLEVGNLLKAHELTLHHALSISPQIKERTIGADMPEFRGNDEQANSRAVVKSTTPSPKTFTVTPTVCQSSLQNFDLDMMNAAVLLREVEDKRKKHIRQKFNEMQEKQVAAMRTVAERQLRVQTQRQQEILVERRRSEAQILAEAEQRTKRELLECQQKLEALRLQSQRQLQLMSIQGIARYQGIFRSKYETIAIKLIVIDRQGIFACNDYNRQLKQLVEMFEQLTGKIKSGDCGAAELKVADELCKKLDALLAAIDEDLDNIVREKQKAQQCKADEEEAEAAAELTKDRQKISGSLARDDVVAQTYEKALPQPKTQTQAVAQAQTQFLQSPTGSPSPATSTMTTGTGTTPLTMQLSAAGTEPESVQSSTAGTAAQTTKEDCSVLYNEIYRFYQDKVDSVKPLQSDENMKKYRFACQKAINIPLNAISAVSPQHLQDKFEKIFNFLNGHPFKAVEGQVSVNDHPLGRTYCLLLTAKRFVNQGETAISSNPQAAFPVASVVVSLWKLIPEFGKLFLAYVFKESPFLVPMCGQSVAEYNDLKRQAGITRLYSAVMITSGRRAEGPNHPYGIEYAWRWLVDFSYLNPLPDISATLIMEMLQTVGQKMCQAYGKQFTKLLLHLQRSYLQRLASVDEGGPKTRLEMLLINYMNQRQLPEPPGLLTQGFW